MEKKIFLPNAETAGKLIDNALKDFMEKMKDNGMDFTDSEIYPFLCDVFVSGYTYGHNDCLTIIRDQIEVDNLTKQFNEKDS